MAMRFEQSQGMKLGQSMKLSPRVIQSMEILQLPIAELEERIEQELENNIALELAEPERDDLDEPINREEATDADSDSFEHLEDLARDNPDYAENNIKVSIELRLRSRSNHVHGRSCEVGGMLSTQQQSAGLED